MTIAVVTGASGFIGTHLCERLHKEGFEVRVLSHADNGYSNERLEQTFDSADIVYHLAGLAHELKGLDAENYRAVNGRLPAILAERADQLGVGAFVWLSTIKVLGDVSERPLRIDDPVRPEGIYARSKVLAEQTIADLNPSLRIATLRPPLVYGPGVRGNFMSLLRLAERGLPVPLKAATAPRTMVSTANLVDLLVRLSRSGEGIFHVGDAQDLSVCDLYSRLCGLLRSRDRQFHVPLALIRSVARLTGRSAQVSRVFDALQVDWSDTQTRLDWRPPHSIDDQLERMMACYRHTV